MKRILVSAACAAGMWASGALAQTTPTPTPAQPPISASSPALRILRSIPSRGPLAAAPIPLRAADPQWRWNYRNALQRAECVVGGGNAPLGEDLLSARPNTLKERFELLQFSRRTRSCARGSEASPVVFLRGSIAEALYKQESIAAAIHARGTTIDDVKAFLLSERIQDRARLRDDRAYSSFARCLVVSSPVQARRLLLSAHGSDQELAAFRDLYGQAPNCTQGTAFDEKSARPFLRAYVAEAALRWARAGTEGAKAS